MKMSKGIATVVASALMLSTIFAGCGGSKTSNSGSASTSAAPTTSAATEAVKEPTKLTMFFGDAGIKFPADVDVSNNPFLNIVEKAANVDLEMIQPQYADFETKFNLAISSGEIPDIVHCWFADAINKNGIAGAFVPLDEYISKSETLSKLYPKEYLDLMRASDGKIYGLTSLDAKNYGATIARMDLIDELNGGVIPKTPDDWYQLMKKEKAKYPDSIPFTSRGDTSHMDCFFRAFGAEVNGDGADWQLSNGKFINSFEAPKMRDAILFHRKLYEEKLLDPTFVTNKAADWETAVNEKGFLVFDADASSALPPIEAWLSKGIKNQYFAVVPHPMEPGVNPENVNYRPMGIGWHTISISSKCKDIDAAIRVIEAFLSPEIQMAAAWGREGTEYTVGSDGKKVLNADESNKTSYRTAYAFMRSYWSPEALDVKISQILPKMDADMQSKFTTIWTKGIQDNNTEVEKNSVYPFYGLTLSDASSNLRTEALTLSKSIIVKAIVGQISMEEYDKQVADFLKKYGSITEEYNKLYSEKK